MKWIFFIIWGFFVAFGLTICGDEPIRLHPENPHYFLWRDKPTILITATEHYGAVINLDFDYLRYLDELQRNRFNLTRVFSGTYRERASSFNIRGNTLAPANGRFICPWARSEISGTADGGNKFDLTKWDEAYFKWLKDFLTEAGKRDIIVELVLFCTMYDDEIWNASPMNPRNNVNIQIKLGRGGLYNARNNELLAIQKALVIKLVTELNAFDNLYFEICNEPYERSGLTKEWNDQIVSTIAETETALPKRHLIAQGFPPTSEPVSNPDPRISIFNFHATTPNSVHLNYGLNKVIAFDETGGSDTTDRKYRTEGWDWILAGGGVFDHLDFSFTTDRPDGSAVPLPAETPGGGGPSLRKQLRILKEFIEGLDFIHMSPDHTAIKNSHIRMIEKDSKGQGTATARVLSEPGKAYAIFINGGTEAELTLELPHGDYKAEWLNTKNGAVEKSETFTHSTGSKTLSSPRYSEDIALRITATQTRGPHSVPDDLAQFFKPPKEYRSQYGDFRSPLLFADGTRVQSAADWPRRRAEILSTWQKLMGPWPPLIEKPRVEILNTVRREDITQQQLRIEIALGGEMLDALLLTPDNLTPPGESPPKRPGVVVVYYDAETGAGLGAPLRDYAWQLAKRGFVTLSIGKPNAQIDLATTNKPRTDPYLGPIGKPVQVQPLSALAYAAANAHTVLSQQNDVDPERIGIVGHSFGGKWAMFASCLYDKFASAVWSDPGIVFDERDRRKQNPSGSVNYYDVWYLGFESGAVADPKNAGPFRKLPSEDQPRTGAYKTLIEGGHDLVELHALMAPRPFLVSGGTADLPERWPALNHSIAVNKLLGYEHRVAMTSREGHTPTEQANEQVYRFFQWSLGGRGFAQAEPARPKPFPHRIWATSDFESHTSDYGWFGPAETNNIPRYPGNATALGVKEGPYQNVSAIMTGINPVPGPRMGKINSLYLRYFLTGSSEAIFQHFSLTTEDNNHIHIAGLTTNQWSEVTMNFTRDAQRNDHTPGIPFKDGERMDDLKIFVGKPGDSKTYNLLIDDVIFFANDPDLPPEPEPFPNRVIFLAAFDTGPKEKYWPGDFEIVEKDLPTNSNWRVARAVPREDGKGKLISLQIDPIRPVGEHTKLRFRYYLTGTRQMTVQIFDQTDMDNRHINLRDLKRAQWQTLYLDFTQDARRNDGSNTPFAAGHEVDDLFFFVEPDGPEPVDLLVDEVVLFDSSDR